MVKQLTRGTAVGCVIRQNMHTAWCPVRTGFQVAFANELDAVNMDLVTQGHWADVAQALNKLQVDGIPGGVSC